MKRQFTGPNPWTPESWMLQKGDRGAVFYTAKKDKDITALASAYNRKVRTRRAVVLTGRLTDPEFTKITEVTLINDPPVVGMVISDKI